MVPEERTTLQPTPREEVPAVSDDLGRSLSSGKPSTSFSAGARGSCQSTHSNGRLQESEQRLQQLLAEMGLKQRAYIASLSRLHESLQYEIRAVLECQSEQRDSGSQKPEFMFPGILLSNSPAATTPVSGSKPSARSSSITETLSPYIVEAALNGSVSHSHKLGDRCPASASSAPSHAHVEFPGLFTPRFAVLSQEHPDPKLSDAVARSLLPLLEATAEHIEHVSKEAVADALAPLHELVARCSSDVTDIHVRIMGDEEPPSNLLGCCSGRSRHAQAERPRHFGALLPAQLPVTSHQQALYYSDGTAPAGLATEDSSRSRSNVKTNAQGQGLATVQTVDSD